VIFAYAAANRDPAAFERPDEMDPDRDGARSHFTFGRGPHACPGAALARSALTHAVQTLLSSAPLLRLAIPRAALVWPGDERPRRLAALPVVLGPAGAARLGTGSVPRVRRG
jgi:cytochrome P450